MGRRKDPSRITRRGVDITTGDRSKNVQSALSRLGIDKKEILAEFEKEGGSLSERVRNRNIGLAVYQEMITPIIDFYNDVGRRGISLQDDLYVLESDLITYRMEHEKDPEWSAIEDKVYQDGLERKAKMMQYINRFNLDYAKFKAEVKKKGYDNSDVINVTEMTREDVDKQ